MKKLAYVLLGLSAVVGEIQAQGPPTPAGSISGTVTDSQSNPVPGAWAMLTLQPPTPLATFTPVSTSVLTQQDGSFSATGLPDGTYQICVSAPTTLYLNPCLWSNTPPTAAISGGQAVTGVGITVQTGYQQVIHIVDTQKLLVKNQGVTPGADLIVGVGFGTAPFNAAVVTGRGDIARDMAIVLPIGFSSPISVYSSFYKLADQNGKALTGSSVSLSASTSTSSGISGAAAGSTPAMPGPITIQIVGTN